MKKNIKTKLTAIFALTISSINISYSQTILNCTPAMLNNIAYDSCTWAGVGGAAAAEPMSKYKDMTGVSIPQRVIDAQQKYISENSQSAPQLSAYQDSLVKKVQAAPISSGWAGVGGQAAAEPMSQYKDMNGVPIPQRVIDAQQKYISSGGASSVSISSVSIQTPKPVVFDVPVPAPAPISSGWAGVGGPAAAEPMSQYKDMNGVPIPQRVIDAQQKYISSGGASSVSIQTPKPVVLDVPAPAPSSSDWAGVGGPAAAEPMSQYKDMNGIPIPQRVIDAQQKYISSGGH